jgi:hypothetical protein
MGMKPWMYHDKEVEEIPENCVGFVYCIKNDDTGMRYVGKKYVQTRRRKKVPGRVNRKVIIAESNWKKYFGSSEFLLDDVARLGEDKFTREILNFYPTKKEVTYAEIEEQFKRNVLRAKLPNGSFEYYNKSILGKFFQINTNKDQPL